jgi:hypothetical protein
MFQEYQKVRLKKDFPVENLSAGSIGVVLIVYVEQNLPRAYEVEFLDEDGGTLALLTLTDEDIEGFETSED